MPLVTHLVIWNQVEEGKQERGGEVYGVSFIFEKKFYCLTCQVSQSKYLSSTMGQVFSRCWGDDEQGRVTAFMELTFKRGETQIQEFYRQLATAPANPLPEDSGMLCPPLGCRLGTFLGSMGLGRTEILSPNQNPWADLPCLSVPCLLLCSLDLALLPGYRSAKMARRCWTCCSVP